MRLNHQWIFRAAVITASAASLAVAAGRSGPARSVVRILRVPEGGIQPQVRLGHDGILRMIYFTGDPQAGDIEYVTRAPGAKEFSKPVRVNSQPGSAVAIGTVRGPQMALGRDGRIEVIWFGSQKALPRGPGGSTPVLFSRSNRAGTAFEPQRNLMQFATDVNGGLSVAADRNGNVYAVWHAAGRKPGEAHRRVYLARSKDGGKTFTREVPVSPASLGACGCCGMRALAGNRGTLYILYRAATGGIHRDMTLLVSKDHGLRFRAELVSPWLLNYCPMTTDYLSQADGRVFAAWEKAGQVYFDEISPATSRLGQARAAPGAADDRKHPAVAANSHGRILLVWTEGTAWAKGGSLAWQIFDTAGRPEGSEGHAPDLPVWDAPSVFANRDGSFTIVY